MPNRRKWIEFILMVFWSLVACSGSDLSNNFLGVYPEISAMPNFATIGMSTDWTVGISLSLSNVDSVACSSLLSARSSNSSLMPATSISSTGTAPRCTLNLGIGAGRFGQSKITVIAQTASSISTSQSFLIYVYPPAQVAYSLRKIVGGYTGPLVNVRRSTDNATSDIPYDLSGNLNQTMLAAFVGTGSAYVTTWYDQSGNSNPAAQITPAMQPRLVNAGTVDLVNSRPSLYFSGGTNGSYLSVNSPLANTTPTISAVVQQIDNSDKFLLLNTVANWAVRYNFGSLPNHLEMYSNASFDSGSQIIPLQLHQLLAVFNGVSSTRYLNGIQGATGSTSNTTIAFLQLGAHYGGFNSWYGFISEMIVFPLPLPTADQNQLYLDQKVFYGTP
jgi:hypothetical protein